MTPIGADEDEDADDLEWKVVRAEKSVSPIVAHVIERSRGRQSARRSGWLPARRSVSQRPARSARRRPSGDEHRRRRTASEVDLAPLLRLQVEQHDDEEEQHHDRAGIDEHLDDADEEGVEPDEQRRESEEAKRRGRARSRPGLRFATTATPKTSVSAAKKIEEDRRTSASTSVRVPLVDEAVHARRPARRASPCRGPSRRG